MSLSLLNRRKPLRWRTGAPHSAPAAVLHGVIFDLDGVLLGTDRLHFAAWQQLSTELGLPFTEETNHHLRGISREESLRTIYRLAGRPGPDAAALTAQCARKNAHYLGLVDRMTAADVFPGAVELLHELREARISIGIASASRNCRIVLERTGLQRFIDAVCDGNDVTVTKPDPQVFLLAAHRLGVPPSNCIGIEDAATGIESIHRAGMAAVGIGPQAAAGDLCVSAIGEVTIDLLRTTLASRVVIGVAPATSA